MDMKKANKTLIYWLCAIIVVMFVLPFGVAGLASAHSAMMFCMINNQSFFLYSVGG